MQGGPLLYVHPYNHVLDELVPMGAVALVNRCPVEKRGCYAWELTPDAVASAGCIALDLHWYFSIEAVHWIARDVKAIAPDVPIVLGGITASFYARHLLASFPVDYIVQGDGEYAFPRLVEALCAGRRPPPLPNVWTRRGPPPSRRPVRGEEYDANDYLTLDWFPTLRDWTRTHHAEYARAPFWGRMDRYHPYLPLNRGCRFPCNGCFGSYQRDVFGPGQVDRSAASLASLLDRAEAHPDYRFVNLTAGTEDMARVGALRDALGRRRSLGAYVMHFCDLPSDDDLELFLGAFDRVCMDFTNPDDVPLPLRAAGWTVERARDRIVEICEAVDGMDTVRVGVSFMDTEPHPFKARLRARDWQRLELKENSEWTLPRPNHATLPGFAGAVHPDDAQADRARAVARRAAAADRSDAGPALPRFPVPAVEHRLLTPAQREARARAKATQADAFREVSRGHARYLLARALAPGLHLLLDQSYLRSIDGVPTAPLAVDDPAVAGFLDWYAKRYRTWFVTTLDRVEVVVRALTDGPSVPGLAPGASGDDLGLAHVRPSMDGIRVAWQGELPPGTVGVALRPRISWRDASAQVQWLDPLALDLDLPTLPAPPGPAGVLARLSPDACTLSLHHRLDPSAAVLPQGEPRSRWRWPLFDTRPPTPWDPPATDQAPGNAAGPTDLVDAPWPDDRWPRHLARVLDRVLASPAVDGWAGTRVACSRQWVHHALTHRSGIAVHTLVLPPGTRRCAWQGRTCRLLVQDGSPDATRHPAGQALLDALQRVLAAVEARAAGPPPPDPGSRRRAPGQRRQ